MGFIARRFAQATSGAGAPATTPLRIGDLYVNTSNGQSYVAVGVASAADWKAILTS